MGIMITNVTISELSINAGNVIMLTITVTGDNDRLRRQGIKAGSNTGSD
jgi:hypothetical protein